MTGGWFDRHPRLVGAAASVAMAAIAAHAGYSAYVGFATGCMRAKYGWHCLATSPKLFVLTLAMTCLACAGSIVGCGFTAFLALARDRG